MWFPWGERVLRPSGPQRRAWTWIRYGLSSGGLWSWSADLRDTEVGEGAGLFINAVALRDYVSASGRSICRSRSPQRVIARAG